MDLIFTNVDSDSPPADTPLLICLTRSFCIIMSKGLLKYSTENLERPSRRYISASIDKFLITNRWMLHDRNYRINSAMFSPTVFEGNFWDLKKAKYVGMGQLPQT